MMAVPTHEALITSLNQSFVLEMTDGRRVEARLVAAPAGTPLDATFTSYSATFELPAGVWLPQDIYRITASDGVSWDLLATPTRPSANGHANLTAVMHYQRSVEPSSMAAT